MPRKRLTILLMLMLAGCAAPGPRPPPAWHSPTTETSLRDLLCRLDGECRWLKFRLYDTDQPLAEIRYGFEIVLSRGMLARAVDEDERAFLLAHELAHLRLKHAPPRSAAERLPLELAADGWAAMRLTESGFDADAGQRLLRRLRDEVEMMEPRPSRGDEALEEYRQRLDAMRR